MRILLDSQVENPDLEGALTYEEWQELDFYVRKGEHMIGRNDKGQPVFGPDQVEEKEDFPERDSSEDFRNW